MNKQELVRDMKQFTGGGFITRQELSKYMGRKDPHSVDEFLHDLEKVKGKYFFIPDVATRLKESAII